MAGLKITEWKGYGLASDVDATDWEVYSSMEHLETQLLFRSLKDKDNLFEKHFVARDVNGKLYEPSDGMYGRCRLWIGNRHSNWFNLDRHCNTEDLDTILHELRLNNKIMSTPSTTGVAITKD